MPVREHVRSMGRYAVGCSLGSRELRAIRPLIGVLASAGLRPGGALALQWRDIREQAMLVERTISLGEEKDTKTAAHRTVGLLPPLAVDLREWRLRGGRPAENALMFPSATGTRWTLATYQSWRRRAFRRAIEAAGLEHGRPQHVRRSPIRGS
jgi:integrase